MPVGEGVLPLLLDDAEDFVGSPVILLLSASGVLDDDGLEAADEGELLDAPMDCVPELLCADALDLLGSSDILALSDDEDEDDEVEGELLLLAGVLALLLLEEGVLLLVADGVVLEDGVLLDAPIDWVLDELSFVDWAVLFSAAFRLESSLAASILSLAFSAPCLVLSPIFLKVSLIRSVMDSPDDLLSVADGVDPGFSCCARALVPAKASVQARAMRVRFMGISLRWRDDGIRPCGRSLSLSDPAGFTRRSRQVTLPGAGPAVLR